MTGIKFPELEQLERIIEQLGDRAQTEVIERIQYQDLEFPIHCITLGSTRPDAPALAFFGGVHGLEKIGSEVILSYMETISQLLDWDQELLSRLEKSRLVFVPIVNPVGVYLGTRCNGNGVDLMRNSPVEGVGSTRIYSGHRITPRLPWYRGDQAKMEKEAQALCRIVDQHLFNSPLSIALDLHSGFGIQDRLWFPYASRQTPFAFLAETLALKELFDRCYRHHIYRIEPTSLEYTINGDLWDYLFDDFVRRFEAEHLFLPLTLEIVKDVRAVGELQDRFVLLVRPADVVHVEELFVAQRLHGSIRRHAVEPPVVRIVEPRAVAVRRGNDRLRNAVAQKRRSGRERGSSGAAGNLTDPGRGR